MNPLNPEKLRKACDPQQFDFDSTAEISLKTETIGQEQAEEALGFGLDIRKPGYNIFALSESGNDRHATVERILNAKAGAEVAPADWCYVNNFENPNNPLLLTLPAGRAAKLKAHLDEFISELPGTISSSLEADEYRSASEKIQGEFKTRHETALQNLGDEAVAQGVALIRNEQGFAFVPTKNNEVLSPEDFAKLPAEEQKTFEEKIQEFLGKLQKLSHQFPKWRREMQTRIRALTRETISLAVGHMIEEIKEQYQDLPHVAAFLDAVLADIVKAGEGLRENRGADDDANEMRGGLATQRYKINVIVDRSKISQAPVVYEDSPNYQNLLGRFDQIAHFGSLLTNFTLIKSGSLHRANGGYLMLEAAKLLAQPFSYDGLKRALKSGKLQIESPLQLGGLMSTVSLEPEAMPLDVKVVLMGERRIYYLLKELDPEFDELFKISADFESDIIRTTDAEKKYAGVIAHLAETGKLKAFSRDAVARLVEFASRASGDAEKLTANTHLIAGLMNEADHRADGKIVEARHIDAAADAQIRRAGRVRRIMDREIERETMMIATTGAEIGQINGLAVVQLPDYAFAYPMRITANVWYGKGNVIDIERESELGGKIHSKGVMILSSYLAWRYAQLHPLTFGASLVFEQSYGPVEGDSASLAELCALLSALAEAAISQELAVTGSVNQHGRVQAIGGVNEKIEGFFDLCNLRGLTGNQGVLIPEANVKHLMLRPDIVAACAAGKFRIFPVTTVDEAATILTGLPTVEDAESGDFPKDTLNFRIAARLSHMAKSERKAAKKKRG